MDRAFKTSWWRGFVRGNGQGLGADRRGAIAVTFAVSLIGILTAIGGGIDLSRAYLAQQKLSETAQLACQYARSPAVTGAAGTSNYVATVDAFIDSTLTREDFTPHYSQLTPVPFTAAQNGALQVTLTSSVSTSFMRIVGISEVPVGATVNCQGSSTPQPPITASTIIKEGFESAPCGPTVCYTKPNGTNVANVPPVEGASSAFPASPSYVGSSGTRWYVTGYCLETDYVGTINPTVPEGTQAAELDCDDGTHAAGNSAISANVLLAVGSYELRWFYRARVDYPDYDPVYLCGSNKGDTSWANDTTVPASWDQYIGNAPSRTNQINVYLDQPLANGNPPMHTTLDGQEQLAGSNMIDQCVYSSNWVERSVRITVTTAGYYWVTFAADGANDSFGGQIDNIRLCQGACPGTPQDNFPTAWLPSNAGGDVVLFQDNFEAPGYSATSRTGVSTNGDLARSNGTSGPSSGWPTLPASGWAVAPVNQVNYVTEDAAQGSQYIELVGQIAANGQNSGHNRLISRRFLLNPGFYALSYSYLSDFRFTGLNGTYCGATPALANLSTDRGSLTGRQLGGTTNAIAPYDVNAVGVFLANAQLVSTPNLSSGLGAAASYTDPDPVTTDTPPATTVSTLPTVAPDAISLAGYTPSATSALLDICGYSSAWAARTVNFEIQKTGYYWLTFSSQMAGATALGTGGAIDNVKLTALGSPAMVQAPLNPVMVPAPDPQPGTAIAFNGFQILQDPLN